MNSVKKTAGMAGFLYFIYGVIHISAGASQQKTAGVAGAKSGDELLTASFSGRLLGKEIQMKTLSPDQNRIRQRRRN